jgi:hypothetical protein
MGAHIANLLFTQAKLICETFRNSGNWRWAKIFINMEGHMIYEILHVALLIISGCVAWESSVMISEKKKRYRAGTHDYYDNLRTPL